MQHLPARQPQARHDERGPLGHDDPVSRGCTRPDAGYAREGLAVCPDVTRWRETVHAPDLEAACTEGWDTCRAEARAACGSDHLPGRVHGHGHLEQCHFLMGFEDTLTNLYAHPDEMHALIDYITEYRLTYVRMLIDNLQPDVIFA